MVCGGFFFLHVSTSLTITCRERRRVTRGVRVLVNLGATPTKQEMDLG